MKHLKPYKSVNESNSIYNETVEEAISVDGVKIDLEYLLDSDDDYVSYTLFIPGKQLEKLATLGIFFNAIDYGKLTDDDRVLLYQTMAEVSEEELEEFGAYDTSSLDAEDAYSIVENEIKFKFGKKFTAKKFVEFCNNEVDIQEEDSTAVLKSDKEKSEHLGSAAKAKALSQFLGSLTQKDYFLLGRDLKYFSTLPGFKALKKHNVTVEEAIDFCLKAVGLENWQKSKNLNKLNNRTGILD